MSIITLVLILPIIARTEVLPCTLDLLKPEVITVLTSDLRHGPLKFRLITALSGFPIIKIVIGETQIWKGRPFSRQCDSVMLHYKEDEEFILNISVRTLTGVHSEYLEKCADGTYRTITQMAYNDKIAECLDSHMVKIPLDISSTKEPPGFNVDALTEDKTHLLVFTTEFGFICTEVKDGKRSLWKAGEDERASLVVLYANHSDIILRVLIAHHEFGVKNVFWKRENYLWTMTEEGSCCCEPKHFYLCKRFENLTGILDERNEWRLNGSIGSECHNVKRGGSNEADIPNGMDHLRSKDMSPIGATNGSGGPPEEGMGMSRKWQGGFTGEIEKGCLKHRDENENCELVEVVVK